MAHRNFFIFLLLLGTSGCGVKGRPLPPLNPAPLGRGDPALKKEIKKPIDKKNKESNVSQESKSVVTEEM